MLLLNNPQPTLLRHISKRTANCLMPHLPSHSFQNGICIWNGAKLELRWWWKFVACKNGSGFGSLLGIFLPFDVSSPTRIFFCKDNFQFLFNLTGFFICGVTVILVVGFGFISDRLIEEWQFTWGQALLELPLIYPLWSQLIRNRIFTFGSR